MNAKDVKTRVNMIEEFITKIENLGFSAEKFEDGNIKIGLECCPFWHIILHELDDERMLPYFYLRKRRTEEVTDLHDMIPTVLTTITKCNGHCSCLADFGQ